MPRGYFVAERSVDDVRHELHPASYALHLVDPDTSVSLINDLFDGEELLRLDRIPGDALWIGASIQVADKGQDGDDRVEDCAEENVEFRRPLSELPREEDGDAEARSQDDQEPKK